MIRLVILGLAIITAPMPGQTLSYFRHFTAPGIDRATAVAADESGIYVCGISASPQSGQVNAGIRKYDSRGNELWTREFDSPYRNTTLGKAAVDATGVYVLAFLGDSPMVWLRKYSSDGDELWTRELDFFGTEVAVDASGVYVTGGNYTSAYLRKYSPDGAELWTSRFGEIQTGAGVSVDATGVYVEVAYSNGAAGIAVRKYDSAGHELWTRQVNSSGVRRTFAGANPTGFYLIAADALGAGTFLRRYDSAGNELWSRRIDLFPDFGSSMVVDATGVYLAGAMPEAYFPYRPFTVLPGQCRSGSDGDSSVRKYDPDGMEVWERQFGTTRAAWASGVAVNASGVYVAGEAIADAGSAFLAKFEKAPAVIAGSGPRIIPGCVVNAASYVGGGVAPGEIVTIFGSRLGPSDLTPLTLTPDGKLTTALADTRILFNGIAAPLLYVSDKQSSAIVPYAVAGSASVDVQVEYNGVRSEAVTMPVLASRPGIFSVDGSGQGQGAILNEDGSLNSPANPAVRGSTISIFATGGGEAAPGVAEGQIAGAVPPRTSLPISVLFDIGLEDEGVASKEGAVLYAGGVSGSVVGLLQVNVRVPASVTSVGDAVHFTLTIGPQSETYQVTVALR